MSDSASAQEMRAWVAYFDIYGFKAIVEANKENLVDFTRRLRACYAQVEAIRSRSTQVFRLSDCFFLVFPLTQQRNVASTLQVAIAEIEKILGVYLSSGLPLRGGMAFGRIVAEPDGIILGSPVSRAVGYEQLLPCPLTMLPVMEIIDSGIPIENLKNNIDLQTRDGIAATRVVLPGDKQEFVRVVRGMYQKYRIQGPRNVAAAWSSALQIVERVSAEE